MPSIIAHNPENKKSRVVGVAATALVHALALVFCFRALISDTVAPPLSPIELLIEPEFERVEEIKPERFEIKPRVTGKKTAEIPPEPTAKTEIDDQSGDVEVPVEKLIPVEIDKRSLFRSEDTGETVANASGARTDNKALFAGDNDPNAADSKSSAAVRGRYIVGKMEQPANTSNREGRVVVAITVDQSGKVTKAQAGAHDTTIPDAALWKAAEEAARKTVFNAVENSPPQRGTITYVFKLK
jgi:TonB family protein